MANESLITDNAGDSFQAYLSRDEAQAQIARSLAEKDLLRGQLMELQARVFTMKACNKQRERREKSRVTLTNFLFYIQDPTYNSSSQSFFRAVLNIVLSSTSVT